MSMAEAKVWHTEQKTQDWTEYYVVLVDGEQAISEEYKTAISFKLAYNAKTKEIRSEPYSPPDINYTIHDGCDHENDECVLDDPESSESEDVFMSSQHHYAVQNLLNLEKQVKQQRIAGVWQPLRRHWRAMRRRMVQSTTSPLRLLRWKSSARGVSGMNPNQIVYAGVKAIADAMSTDELVAVYMGASAGFNPTYVKGYEKAKSLFTESDGTRMHSTTLEMLDKIVQERLKS